MIYGLIGEKLGHSFSPEIHACIGNYPYELRELAPDAVAAFLEKKEFSAINVTIPYKETVIPFCDEIDEAAKAIGAVNTIVNRGGKLYGYNTDFAGLQALIAHTGINPKGKKALILGTGGTCKTAAAVLKAMAAAEIVIAGRTPREGIVGYDALPYDAEILINTTPCGMYPNINGFAADPSDFPKLQAVIDVVYNPLRTDLLQKAERLGIPHCGGMLMLATQAIRAAEYFFDKPIAASHAQKIVKQVENIKSNIVLIGMPASGKTTVGRAVAKSLGRPFIDADEELIQSVGRSIPDIFKQEGEAGFRRYETQTIHELAGRNGCVIATGGGAVLNSENVRLLKKNGRIYFLDRSPDKLIPTADRPTASSVDAIQARYRERYPLYQKSCDRHIDADGDIEQVTKQILEDYL